jgi:hypothetical protein
MPVVVSISRKNQGVGVDVPLERLARDGGVADERVRAVPAATIHTVNTYVRTYRSSVYSWMLVRVTQSGWPAYTAPTGHPPHPDAGHTCCPPRPACKGCALYRTPGTTGTAATVRIRAVLA